MNLKDITLKVAVLKVLADEVAERLQVAKAEAEAAFRETGTTQAVPELADGTKVATASLAGDGRKSATVTNEAAFLAWMKRHHPDEIVTTVRESARTKILAGAKAAGRPVDVTTGEIVPGVTVGDSRSYVSLRFKPGGAAAIVAAWRAGELAAIDLVAPEAIEAGDAA